MDPLPRELVLTFDGSAPRNVGRVGLGWTATAGGVELAYGRDQISGRSNSVAEISALLAGLRFLHRAHAAPDVLTLRGDSQFALRAVDEGRYLHDSLCHRAQQECREILADLGATPEFLWIPRGWNARCDALAREGWRHGHQEVVTEAAARFRPRLLL